MGGDENTVTKNTDTLIDYIKESGLDVKAYKSKNTVTYRDQKAGQYHDIKTGNSSLQYWNSSNIWEQA